MSRELREAAGRARAAMRACRLCALRCGADRTSGPAGACRTDAVTRVFHEGIEWAGESELVPTYVVSLSGCNMACAFCLTGGASQDGRAGTPLDGDAVGERIRVATGLRSVTILGGEPTVHLDGAIEIAARVPRSLLLVWKTNATASAEALRLLRGIPDVVLADFKFGNDRCAGRIASMPDYVGAVRSNLRAWARRSRLIVRHLVMPGHLDCCFRPVAEWLAREMPRVPLSLMTGYLPAHRAWGELARTNRAAECRRAAELVRTLGVHLVPWRIARGPSAASQDELWIDPRGRVCADSASPALLSVLNGPGAELVI
ncbi:MAG: radical SAM protein [Planctomycetes bacterium]|nr:radical SAM protein [Planctomycetota bacterium]